MRSSAWGVLSQTVCLGLLLTAVVGCGGRQTATPASKTSGAFTTRDVARAFADVGLELHDPSPGSSGPHLFVTVAMLASVQPHDGWSVAAYIYPTPSQANASFAQDVGDWSASGIESVQIRNVVVVVIPRAHLLTRRARFFPMPKLVYTALGFLTRSR